MTDENILMGKEGRQVDTTDDTKWRLELVT